MSTETIQNIIAENNVTTYLDLEAFAGYAENLGLDVEDFLDWQDEAEEAYAGQFGDNAEFAENLATELGLVKSDATWPNNCIDWDSAAVDLMHDYFEVDGYYFRNA